MKGTKKISGNKIQYISTGCSLIVITKLLRGGLILEVPNDPGNQGISTFFTRENFTVREIYIDLHLEHPDDIL